MPGIIVGVDGSDHSYHALEWALAEAAVRRAALTVLTVCQPAAGYWGSTARSAADPDPADPDPAARHARELAQKETDTALAKAGPAARPPSVTVRAVTGLAADALLRAAAGADMLVVGSRGTGGFSRLRLGSVGVQVTHHAPCPVVVIPNEVASTGY
jgi:nucleotide-binding universal stress UspA family protein